MPKKKKVSPAGPGYLARGRFLRIPPAKARIMTRNVVGLEAGRAVETLTFTPNKSAALILKILRSAIANADKNFKQNVDDLYVSSVLVDRGSTMKRFHPCAHGRAKPILKRSSHITVVLRAADGRATSTKRKSA